MGATWEEFGLETSIDIRSLRPQYQVSILDVIRGSTRLGSMWSSLRMGNAIETPFLEGGNG